MRMVLLSIVKSQQPNSENLSQIINLAKQSISSDYEMRVLLNDIAKQLKDSPEAIHIAIEALTSLQSDFEFRMAATSIVKHADLQHDAWLKLINSTKHMSSDYETSQLLLNILSKIPEDKALIAAIANSVEQNISSDHESERVSKALKKAER